jgi:hypothetical protein
LFEVHGYGYGYYHMARCGPWEWWSILNVRKMGSIFWLCLCRWILSSSIHKHAKQNKTKHIPSHVKSAKKNCMVYIYDLGWWMDDDDDGVGWDVNNRGSCWASLTKV